MKRFFWLFLLLVGVLWWVAFYRGCVVRYWDEWRRQVTVEEANREWERNERR